ncbi:MAG: class I SAM-dependent methyltransferase [Alphaproteobacteria bacterium]
MPDDFQSYEMVMTRPDAPFWPAAERLLSLPPEWRIRRDGSLAWLDPTPSFEWYRNFYNKEYANDPLHAELSRNPEIRTRKEEYFRRRIVRIVKCLGHKPIGILDVGAGDGIFLSAARRSGHAVIGVELCAKAARKAARETGVPVLAGDILHDDLTFSAPIDVVVMHHVFEHLLTPLDYLQAIRDLLQPGGIFAFEIPQQFINPIDLAYRALGRKRPFTAYSLHHPYFYTVDSIKRMLQIAGYEILALRTWVPGQVFHVESRIIGTALQGTLWVADAVAKKGHVIEVLARPT